MRKCDPIDSQLHCSFVIIMLLDILGSVAAHLPARLELNKRHEDATFPSQGQQKVLSPSRATWNAKDMRA